MEDQERQWRDRIDESQSDNKLPSEEWGVLTAPEFRYLLIVLGLLASVMPFWYVVTYPDGYFIGGTTMFGLLTSMNNTGLHTAAILFYLALATLAFRRIRWTAFGALLLFSSFIIGFYSAIGLNSGFKVVIGGAHALGLVIFFAMLLIVYARYRQIGLRF
jgi:hypothetical protein